MKREAENAPLTIVQYWHSAKPPDDVAALIDTFRARNPGARHVLFDERSAERFVATRFGERHASAFRACAVPAMQADYLRYCAVLVHGGVYADADLRCVASLDSLLAGIDAGILFGWRELPPRWRTPYYEGPERVGAYRVVLNSLFAFSRPGHPLLEQALELATLNIERRVSEEVAAVTGPGVLTALYLLRRLGSMRAFSEYASGGAFEPLEQSLRDAVGGESRIERAFKGVKIGLHDEGERWAAQAPVEYKQSSHWTRTEGTSIFRQGRRG